MCRYSTLIGIPSASPSPPNLSRYDPDHKESLLCEANARRAQQTFRNLRLSCNVAGNCELQASQSLCLCLRLGRLGH